MRGLASKLTTLRPLSDGTKNPDMITTIKIATPGMAPELSAHHRFCEGHTGEYSISHPTSLNRKIVGAIASPTKPIILLYLSSHIRHLAYFELSHLAG